MDKLSKKGWRLQHLYKIKTQTAQLQTFKVNRAQKHYFENRHARNVILKSRQLGFTTGCVIDMLDDALWHKNFDCLLIAQTLPAAQEIFDNKVTVAFDHYPLKEFMVVDSDRSNKLKFGGKGTDPSEQVQFSSILVATSGRSGTYQKIHISEFGKICATDPAQADEIISGALQTLVPGGHLTIESTAEGESGAFYNMFWDAWNRPKDQPIRHDEFKAHFYNWQWDDVKIAAAAPAIPRDELPQYFQDYQDKFKLSPLEITFYYQKWKEMGKNFTLLQREYPTTPEEAFASSGERFFDLDNVDKLKADINPEPDSTYLANWTIHQKPNRLHKYAIGADPSEGVNKDNAAAVVMDFSTPKPTIVAKFKDKKTPPDVFAYELANAGRMYGFALIAVERNNHGHTTLSKLKEIYPWHCIYKEVKDDQEEKQETERLGWVSNVATRPKMLYNLNTFINEQLITIPDKEIIEELRTFPKDKVSEIKIKKDQEHHWDLVIATALVLQMQNEALNGFMTTKTYSTSNEESNPYSPI